MEWVRGERLEEDVMGRDRDKDDLTDADTAIVSSLLPPAYG